MNDSTLRKQQNQSSTATGSTADCSTVGHTASDSTAGRRVFHLTRSGVGAGIRASAPAIALLMPLLIGRRAFAISSIPGLPSDRGDGVQLLILLTVLALVPSILILMTGFTRIVIVLSFVRNALGLQQMPPNQVIIGLALILNFFFMAPFLGDIKTQAYDPYVANQISQEQAIEAAMNPLRDFMLRQVYSKDLDLFMEMGQVAPVPTIKDIPTRVLVPAFVTSELKRSFQIGFFIFVPFLVIDMIVASTLMSMGMMMLPPTVISLPFKILLFVLVDGWSLVIRTLFESFNH